MSGKEHCSLGEALNPAVSSAVLAYCNRLCIKTEYVFKKCHYGTVKISHYKKPCSTYLASLLGSALKGIFIVVCNVNKRVIQTDSTWRLNIKWWFFRTLLYLSLYWSWGLWSRHLSQYLYLHPTFPQSHPSNWADHPWLWLNLWGQSGRLDADKILQKEHSLDYFHYWMVGKYR